MPNAYCTCKVTCPEMLPELAVMVTVPAATPVTTPALLTVANAEFDVCHVALEVMFLVVLSANVAVAVI